MTRQLPTFAPSLRLLQLLLALLALSPASTSSHGSAVPVSQPGQRRQLRVFGRDDRVQLPNTAASPYSAVGLLRWNAETLCTASLVADAVVVTAAECVLDRHGELLATDSGSAPVYFPGAVRSSLSASEPSAPALQALVTTVHKQSDYWVRWTKDTYVLLELDAPLGATVGTLGLPALGELDPRLEKAPVQMASYRVDTEAASLTYQSCTCRFPRAFAGAPYLVHHDCDASPSGSPGAPLLVNYSSSETYIVGIHSNTVGTGASGLAGAAFATYNDAVANRGVLAPLIRQHLRHVTARRASTSGSTSTDEGSASPSAAELTSGEGAAASAAANEDEETAASASTPSQEAQSVGAPSTSASLDAGIAVGCICLVGVAWACIALIASRRAQRRAQPPEPLMGSQH